MGKSLSIIAITFQVYTINGWSIWPPHLALGDDVELPVSMEHLRPYLRKRSGPIIAPPGLRHNQRYYPKSTQSRQLLTDDKRPSLHIDVQNDAESDSSHGASSELSSIQTAETPNNNAVDVEHELIETVVEQMKHLYNNGISKLEDSFLPHLIALFQQLINSPHISENMRLLRQIYEHYRFHPFMVSFINLLVIQRRNYLGHNVDTMPVTELLQRLTSVPQGNKDELTKTLESLSQDILVANSDNLWKYRIWYRLLYPKAVRQGLVPEHIYHDIMRDEHTTSNYQLNGIIEFTGDNIDNEHKLSENKSFIDYVDCLKNMIKNEKYPELNKPTIIIEYLQTVFSELNGDFGDLYLFAHLYPMHVEGTRKSFFDVWSLGTYGVRTKVKAIKQWLRRQDVGPWLGKHDGFASIFLNNDRNVNDFYLFNKEAFNKVSKTRQVSEEDKYYYSLSFVSQELMYNSRGGGIGRSVIIWMYKKLLNEQKAKALIQDDDREKGQLFRKFGWIYDKHILDVNIKFEGFGLYAFKQYMGFLMDIVNWGKAEYQLQTDCNAPFLNTMEFKIEYLVKVLKDGHYQFKGYQVQNEQDARVIITIQNILNEWYDDYNRQKLIEPNLSASPLLIEQVDRSIIETTFSKDLLGMDYTSDAKNTAFGRLGANIMSKLPKRKGSALSQEALNYFF